MNPSLIRVNLQKWIKTDAPLVAAIYRGNTTMLCKYAGSNFTLAGAM